MSIGDIVKLEDGERLMEVAAVKGAVVECVWRDATGLHRAEFAARSLQRIDLLNAWYGASRMVV